MDRVDDQLQVQSDRPFSNHSFVNRPSHLPDRIVVSSSESVTRVKNVNWKNIWSQTLPFPSASRGTNSWDEWKDAFGDDEDDGADGWHMDE